VLWICRVKNKPRLNFLNIFFELDVPTVDYALSIIQQGCANVVAVHLKDPDTAMHT
jgi:hypothetical protein